jgi:outer membrane lipoprotein SlyB
MKKEEKASDEVSALDAALILVGAGFGARLANYLVCGKGLSSILAQAGGAVLGGIWGKDFAEAIQKREKRPGWRW